MYIRIQSKYRTPNNTAEKRWEKMIEKKTQKTKKPSKNNGKQPNKKMRDATNSSARNHIWSHHFVYIMAFNGIFNVLNMCILDFDLLLAICYWLRFRSKVKRKKWMNERTNKRMNRKKKMKIKEREHPIHWIHITNIIRSAHTIHTYVKPMMLCERMPRAYFGLCSGLLVTPNQIQHQDVDFFFYFFHPSFVSHLFITYAPALHISFTLCVTNNSESNSSGKKKNILLFKRV